MLRSWDLKLQIDRVTSTQSLHLQIAQKIIDEIQKGRLAPCMAMPGSRELAESLNVNRKTVVLTYTELIAQGWLITEGRRGTFVPKKLPNFSQDSFDSQNCSGTNLDVTVEPPYQITPYLSQTINFCDGPPDVRLIPFEALSRSFRRALVSSTRSNTLNGVDPKGSSELRSAIARMLNMERAFQVDQENICVVQGSKMGVYIAAKILTKADDCIVVETLSNPAVWEIFRSFGAQIQNVGVDEDGMKVEELEKLCKKKKIRAVFITPQCQFPTTVALSEERRNTLLRLADQYDFLIIEDDHDHEYAYSSTPIFPTYSHPKNSSERVLYIGSLTSLLSPGFNFGYLVGSLNFIKNCSKEIMLIDSERDVAKSLAILELMRSGEIKRHMRRMTKVYRERRDFFKELLENELQEWIEFDAPEGGLAFWCRFKSYMELSELIREANANHVVFENASNFSVEEKDVQAIRLGFGSLNNKEMTEGIARLRKAIENIHLMERISA